MELKFVLRSFAGVTALSFLTGTIGGGRTSPNAYAKVIHFSYADKAGKALVGTWEGTETYRKEGWVKDLTYVIDEPPKKSGDVVIRQETHVRGEKAKSSATVIWQWDSEKHRLTLSGDSQKTRLDVDGKSMTGKSYTVTDKGKLIHYTTFSLHKVDDGEDDDGDE